jgi:3-oxoacyl-[acyl-carrier-protein] synthase-3
VVDPQDKTVRPLFGDGAGAVVLTAGQESEFGALGGFDLGSDGTQDALFRLPGGGTRARAAGGPSGDYVEMDGRGLFVNAVSAMASSSRAVLAATGRGPGDVDRVVGHQANLRILKMVAGQLNLPEDRLVSNIDRVANTSAASIPLALADGIDSGAVVEGHTVLLTAFGAGLTWGSTVMIWPKILVNGGEQ